MSRANLILNSALILFSLGVLQVYTAKGQDNLTLSGRVLVQSSAQQSSPRFTVKLYPPLKSGKAVVLTVTDYKGNFKFTGLSADSYLLELYLVKDLLYQEVIGLNNTLDNKVIDLRKNSSARPPKRQNTRSRARRTPPK